MHLIDKTITWNAFRASFKSKFTIIWGSIMFVLTFSCFFIFALVQQGSANLLFYNIVATSLLVLLTVMVWNIVNLNSLFSANQELGIMNLEIRKGRSSKEIYLSRLLVNKGISLGYILIMMAFYLIIFAIFNHRDLTTFWMFLTYIPTDLFFTALFLFFYSLGRYKLTIALSSILLTLIFLTPLLQMIGILTSATSGLYTFRIPNAYAASEVLNLSKLEQDDSTTDSHPAFTYELLNEAQNLNDPIDTSSFNSDDYKLKEIINDMANSMLSKGLIFDGAKIVSHFWNNLPELRNFGSKKSLEVTNEAENSLIYQINQRFAKKGVGIYSNDYQSSLYSDYKVTSKHYESILKKLKSLNNEITEAFSQNYFQVKEFNNLVYSYAQGMLFNGSSPGEYGTIYDSNGTIEQTFFVKHQDYLERLAGGGSFAGLEKLDKKTLFSQLSISPELRLWNEVAYQLIKNALDTNFNGEQVNKSKISLVAFIPWTVQFSAWIFANPNLNFYQYWRLNSAAFPEPLTYWVSYDDSHIIVNNQLENSSGPFKSLNLKEIEINFPSYVSFKTFSIPGYEIAIAGISIVLMGLAFLIFFKRLKK